MLFTKKQFDKYKCNYKVKTFKCWLITFLCLIFGQLTHRASLLSNCTTCIKAAVARSTLSNANEVRDWRIFADIAHYLIKSQKFVTDDIDFSLELDMHWMPLQLTCV